MEGESNNGSSSNGEKRVNRFPLSEVVSDCVHRWFQDTLKEAKAGDISMQVLVAQMYFNGYGVPIDEQKVPFLSLVSFPFIRLYAFFIFLVLGCNNYLPLCFLDDLIVILLFSFSY